MSWVVGEGDASRKSRSASGDILSDQELCYTSLLSTVPNDSKRGQ